MEWLTGMASYHLSVKTVKRSAGRTATASAAYRAGERIHCVREGREHDYTRKQGIEDTFIVAPADAPDWVQDRS
ncbi:MobA/MobL family protein, partial [uncultured Aliiroseovarius sp.]|uniref:MobA/MobL family protein n=1 Tax=uncultured Aliiroseovarius sp. TaxID=1658783 RepID=UPI002594D44C